MSAPGSKVARLSSQRPWSRGIHRCPFAATRLALVPERQRPRPMTQGRARPSIAGLVPAAADVKRRETVEAAPRAARPPRFLLPPASPSPSRSPATLSCHPSVQSVFLSIGLWSLGQHPSHPRDQRLLNHEKKDREAPDGAVRELELYCTHRPFVPAVNWLSTSKTHIRVEVSRNGASRYLDERRTGGTRHVLRIPDDADSACRRS